MHWGAEASRHQATRHIKSWMVTAVILTEIGGPLITPVRALAATPATAEQTLENRSGEALLGSSSSADRLSENSGSESRLPATEVTEPTTVESSTVATHETATTETGVKPKKPDTPKPAVVGVDRPRETSKQVAESIDQWMPNKRLQRAIFYQLIHLIPVPDDDKTWQSIADITKADMKRLKALFIGYYGGENGESTYNPGGEEYRLDGLEYATNLETLMMGGGGTDEAPYQNFGNIKNLSPLKKLTSLKTLWLSNNQISDVTPLAGLTNLTELRLHDNFIADFSSLKNIPADVSDNQTYQYIFPDPIKVNSWTRKAHLTIPIHLQNGELATGVDQHLEDMYLVHNYEGGALGHGGEGVTFWYTQGGAVTEDGKGGLDFANIRDQAQFPEGGDQAGNYYFLIGKYVIGKDPVHRYSFWIVQRYDIGEAAEPVTVTYQDEQGQELAASQTLNGDIGDAYQTEAATIPGYELTETPVNAQGTFGEEPITVTYIYRKPVPVPPVTPPVPNPTPNPTPNPQPVPTPAPGPKPTLPAIKQGRVTVHYQTAGGMPVHSDTRVVGQLGSGYRTQPLPLANYHVVGRPTNAVGIFGEQPVDVTYTYAPNVVSGGQGDGGEPAEPPLPVESGTASGNGQTDQPTTTLPIQVGSTFATAMQSKKHPMALPTTNERVTPIHWLGWGVLVACLGGWWFKRRRQ
ncbi:MucBP domain-containing protein [Levilactobacillus wangkuiensis]|uniref:MucBP domain-containing protein n=1 Tax=Levilactobacillus wangkuiensis TaxID=2799566 RepID=UPI0027E5A2A4|nr:MucBP domain-containing protein [Levilactobacillus wangkuiensis]